MLFIKHIIIFLYDNETPTKWPMEILRSPIIPVIFSLISFILWLYHRLPRYVHYLLLMIFRLQTNIACALFSYIILVIRIVLYLSWTRKIVRIIIIIIIIGIRKKKNFNFLPSPIKKSFFPRRDECRKHDRVPHTAYFFVVFWSSVFVEKSLPRRFAFKTHPDVIPYALAVFDFFFLFFFEPKQ